MMKLVSGSSAQKRPGRNDPCSCGSGLKYKKCCLDRDHKADFKAGLIDPTSVRREMEQMMGKIGKLTKTKKLNVDDLNRLFVGRTLDEIDDELETMGSGTVDPRERAEELAFNAQEAATTKERRRLAKEALEIYPDCVSAHILLAEEAPTAAETLQHFQMAVESGERDLVDLFKNDGGHFWGLIETRPYMRAKFFLGQVLWDLGRRDEALTHYWDCLRLNTNDNQGVRYTLFVCLLVVSDLDGVEKLLKKYKDDAGTEWTYNKALYYFKKYGPDSKKAEKQVWSAVDDNPHVPKYLLGKKKMPQFPPDSYIVGSVDEAVCYVLGALDAWKGTPGALKWLASVA